MNGNQKGNGVDRRQALECMAWGGTGLVWTLSGGIPGASLIGVAEAAKTGFSFVQISDSHVGFDKPANPNALGTLEEAIAKIGALPIKPAFMIHTGDITHLSKPQQFDDAEQRIARAKLEVHYVPGEHDIIDETNGQAYLDRYGKGSKGRGWFSFDHGGSSPGSPTIFAASPHRRPSSSSLMFRYGRSRRNGGGARRMRRRR
jgi:3',5'-cyclic-AMP phosphodiesterase